VIYYLLLLYSDKSYLIPIFFMAFSYTVQAREAIRDLLSILGARPARNPPTPDW